MDRWRALLLLASVLAAGCADLTSGGARGETETYLAGDEPDAAATSGPPTGAAMREGPAPDDASATATIDATVTVGLQVFLDGGPEGSVELTSGVQTQSVPAQGAAMLIATQRVAVGAYARARAVFTRIEADVRSGLVVGGLPIVGVVRVSASAQDPVVVERAVQVEVTEAGVTAIVVDLNAPTWLAAAAPPGNVVARGAFAGAVEIGRR